MDKTKIYPSASGVRPQNRNDTQYTYTGMMPSEDVWNPPVVTATAKDHDPVNYPSHYTHGEVECIDAIKSALGAKGFEAYCRGQVIKYTWRADHKDSYIQDLKKARWYLNAIIGDK